MRADDPVARIGNNGWSFHPHVHVGAFRGDMMSEDAVPLQVRMDPVLLWSDQRDATYVLKYDV